LKKILVVHNIFPVYIKGFWDKLIYSDELEFEFYLSPKDYKGIKGLKIEENYKKEEQKKFHYVKNYVFNGILFWQSGIIKTCLFKKYESVIFLGEANIISTWIAAVIARIRFKKVIFRGHGLYGNEKGIKLILRKFFYKIPSVNLTYSEGAKKRMIDKGFSKNKTHVIFNSLQYAYQKNLFNKFQNEKIKKNWDFFESDYPVLFFLGRLTKVKKIDLLMKAVIELNRNAIKFNLLIIGDGEEYQSLKKLAAELIENGQCHFTGEVYEEQKLANYIYYSDLCVSPGNVGLTALHSLSYGTPVATHNNLLRQGPEHEIIQDFVNGFYFQENSSISIVENTIKWFEKQHQKVDRKTLRQPIDSKYNPNYQFDLIKRII